MNNFTSMYVLIGTNRGETNTEEYMQQKPSTQGYANVSYMQKLIF